MVLSLSERSHSNEGPYLVSMMMFPNLLIPSSEQHHPTVLTMWQQALSCMAAGLDCKRCCHLSHNVGHRDSVPKHFCSKQNLLLCQEEKHVWGEQPCHCKTRWTRQSPEPVPVNIFIGVVILDINIHITVSSVQVHMNGPTLPLKNSFIFKFTESPMQSGCFRTMPHVPLSRCVVATVHRISAF